MPKNLNQRLDELLSGLELPGDDEIRKETTVVKRTNGIKDFWLSASEEHKAIRGKKISESKKEHHPNKGKSLTKEWKKNVSKNLKGKPKPERSEQHRKAFMKPLMSEDGPFQSVKDAQEHFGYKWEGNVRHKIKKGHPGWYWLTQEEYDKLKK